MAIIGYSIKSVIAERKGNVSQQLNINSTPKITSVDKKEVNLGGKKEVLNIGFEFVTEYKPDVGRIKIVGELFYTGKNDKGVLKEWEKNKKLPIDVDAEVKNFLFRKCLTIGINLSEQLQLPPPLMFPIVVPKKEEESKKYIG